MQILASINAVMIRVALDIVKSTQEIADVHVMFPVMKGMIAAQMRKASVYVSISTWHPSPSDLNIVL